MTTTSHDTARPVRSRALPALLLLLAAIALAAVGCGPTKVEKQRSVFEMPLATLADSGQVEAMRVVADIEVLRAQGMFTDSLANSLMELPASEYMALDDQGTLTRIGRGLELGTLVEFIAVEPQLLQELVITPAQAAELRRLAMENMSAAADMATDLRGPPAETPN